MTASEFNNLSIKKKIEILRFGNTKYGYYWKSETNVLLRDWYHRLKNVHLASDYHHLLCSFDTDDSHGLYPNMHFDRDEKHSKVHTPNSFKYVLNTYRSVNGR